jgi:hypothetical protein
MAMINGATLTYGDTGYPVPLTDFNIQTINGGLAVLQDVGGYKDYLGNAIETLRNGGFRLSPLDYATFDAITIDKDGGAIVVEFELCDLGDYHILGNGSATISNLRTNADGDLIVESDTDTDYFCNDETSLASGTTYKLIVNADSGTVKTYLKSGTGALTLIDTRTPSDDITFSNLSNSISTVRMDGVIRKVLIIDRKLKESELNILGGTL